ncbi:25S rRNA (adenine-N(1))-methyltransferase [Physcia stellaris]|nr:25S rRNA (adenine-N(1))-methyltransferase [Physcia stellaris]
MFAVTGWSVSADILKTQADPADKITSHATPEGKKEQLSKKRKRGTKHPNGTEISGDNLAELWAKHIEGSGKESTDVSEKAGVEQQHKKKRRKSKGKSIESVAKQAKESKADEDEEISEKQYPEEEPRKPSNDPDNEGNHVAVDVEKSATSQEIKETGKAKYEARMKKKLEKELLRASGQLPPSRHTQSPKSTHTPQISKHSSAVKEAVSGASMSTDSAKDDGSSVAIDPLEKSSSTANLEDKSTNEVPKKSRLPSPSMAAPPPPTTKSKAKKIQSNDLPLSPPHKAKNAPPSTTTVPPLPPPAPSPASKLTPLQAKMQSKLLSARFRHLNQTLYTSPSAQASALFTSTPSAYTSYHAGFRAQVAARRRKPGESRKREREKRQLQTDSAALGIEGNKDIEPLPRTSNTCTIADLGCGDATLAASLLPDADPKNKNLKLKLHSFDLAKGDGPNAHLVTVADITSLPLKDGEVDVAVLCLSLMGTNWVSCVDEVARVVRWGGEAWVAEIKSRFARVGKRREGGIGKTKETAKRGKKRKGGAGGEDEDGDGDVVEVDSDPDILAPGNTGKEKKKMEEETDVSAFVEVWRRRGFELKGEVDLGNKMFVRMRFVKRGKPKEDGIATGRDRPKGKMGAKTKFIDEENDEDGDLDEAKVLKPCVYKLR